MAQTELRECDIIMKGGITSGVVYPKAILELSKNYQFRSIGGTSAGALAAVITAGAEYNRNGGGFKTIAELPTEIRTKLETLFQPSPTVEALFNAAKFGFLERRWVNALGWLLSVYWLPAMTGVLAGALAAAIALNNFENPFAALLLFLIGLVAGVLLLMIVVVRTVFHELKELDFGFCPGRTQPHSINAGPSDWLAAKIEIAAGRMTEGGPWPQAPLTFGDIWRGPDGTGSEEKPVIDLRMMTTNLSMRRPHALPHIDRNHYFKEAEFRRIFPDWIVDYLVANSKQANDDTPNGYCTFPSPASLPLVVAARMSLSFPILFAAVPIYRLDYPHKDPNGKPIVERMLFSDGGLSSNFPVHFFDALLPNRPTFGISLETYDERDPSRRVQLPMNPHHGIYLDSEEIDSLPSFLVGLVNAAKDWQDRTRLHAM
jgi:hypothetical protein